MCARDLWMRRCVSRHTPLRTHRRASTRAHTFTRTALGGGTTINKLFRRVCLEHIGLTSGRTPSITIPSFGFERCLPRAKTIRIMPCRPRAPQSALAASCIDAAFSMLLVSVPVGASLCAARTPPAAEPSRRSSDGCWPSTRRARGRAPRRRSPPAASAEFAGAGAAAAGTAFDDYEEEQEKEQGEEREEERED